MLNIGITYTGTAYKHQNYVNWLTASGEEINVVKFSIEENNAALIEQCDALVLSGGIDIRPDLYGGDPDYNNAPEEFNHARDEFELNLYRLAIQKNIPVLGICRGCQLINCAEGGTLRQDHGHDLNDIHWAETSPPDKSHKVILENNTLLYGITLIDSEFVSSAHHQAIDRLGDGLLVNCHAEDGTIEGLEWLDKSNKPFLLGVQWHPERMYLLGLERTPLSRNIRDHFIKEIKQAKSGKQ